MLNYYSVTVNSLKKENDNLRNHIVAVKQNIKDLQKLLRKTDTPTKSKGGLSTLSLLDLDTPTSLEFYIKT